MIKTKNFALLVIPFLIVFSACSSFGSVSRSYDYSKDEIWEAMKTCIQQDHGGIKKVEYNPPTIISNIAVRDKKFGMDKATYQVYASLSGFVRPFVVDVEVRSYQTGEESEGYTSDRPKAQEIIERITKYLNDRKYNSSLQDEYKPY